MKMASIGESMKFGVSDITSSNQARVPFSFHVLFLFFVSAMFSVSLVSLFSYHLYLVSKNRTTLEAFRAPVTRDGPDKMVFHLGKRSNFQVSGYLGNFVLTWSVLYYYTTLYPSVSCSRKSSGTTNSFGSCPCSPRLATASLSRSAANWTRRPACWRGSRLPMRPGRPRRPPRRRPSLPRNRS